MDDIESTPSGVTPVEGIVHRRSPYSVDETVARLVEDVRNAGALVFGVVDHSGEAQKHGQTLRNTKLVIFGNPAAGTAVMAAAPLAAIDLPLKVLVWADDAGAVWMSYLDGQWLAARHHVPGELAPRLAAPDSLTHGVALPG